MLPSACVWLDGRIRNRHSYYQKAIQSAESNPIEIADILRDLRRRKSNWLRSAARDMAKAMEGDWKRYKDS